MDSRSPRDGRVLEEIGLYHPIEKKEKQISIDASRVKKWLARGATPSDTVKQLVNRAAAGRESAPQTAAP
jgi:small subunit ribosomal protein S16